MPKAQAALEYLLIIAMTFAIIIPTVYLFFTYSRESNIKIIDFQISSIGRNIVNTAESIYYSGENSKTVLEFNMPEGVNNVLIISNKEVVFNVTTDFGYMDIVFFSDVNITSNSCSGNICSLSPVATQGFQKLRVRSISNGKQVLIEKE
ncbi:hypothetical protein J4458_05725 [Candidatus Woesearchaeota archaeon]|nr:hypothetical protein [Candidatus Woesearchaeota archaeon]